MLRCSATLLLLLGTVLVAGLLAAAVDAVLYHPLSTAFDVLLVAVGGGLAVAALLAGAGSVVRQGWGVRTAAARVAALEVRPGVVADPAPRAFCVGVLRPRVVVTTGALARLSARELDAVLAHERVHVRRRDGLRLLLARALADGLFFCPGALQLAARLAALAELQADAAADRAGLAGAMLQIDGVCAERVDRLLGQPVRWSVDSAALGQGGLVVLGLALTWVALGLSSGCEHHPIALAAGVLFA